ncbi:hypothetical protein [Amycolatopsis anabasis]|uniref:hypothetical protein n=1 Tax=Amycolatopsis anabasis TaxID=1840409 RepID=UPI00131EA545|nr:hypothetical protein [Amycolatopsis anabasis]
MSNSPDDPNAALLAQLQTVSAVSGMVSNDDVLAMLTADPDPDPLDGVEYTGDEEADGRAELDALHRGFRERQAREAERMALATETEFWFAVCFKHQADKDAFLAAANLTMIGDKYLDGYAVAKLLGVTMPDPDQPERG